MWKINDQEENKGIWKSNYQEENDSNWMNTNEKVAWNTGKVTYSNN